MGSTRSKPRLRVVSIKRRTCDASLLAVLRPSLGSKSFARNESVLKISQVQTSQQFPRCTGRPGEQDGAEQRGFYFRKLGLLLVSFLSPLYPPPRHSLTSVSFLVSKWRFLPRAQSLAPR